MGWEFSPAWKSIDDLLHYLSASRFKSEVVVLSHPEVTREHDLHIRWQAILHEGHSHIICDLLDTNRGSWGYKSMSDEMGPFYYSCPESVLAAADLHPASSESALQWRADCRKK